LKLFSRRRQALSSSFRQLLVKEIAEQPITVQYNNYPDTLLWVLANAYAFELLGIASRRTAWGKRTRRLRRRTGGVGRSLD
jgi:hypothetical protein